MINNENNFFSEKVNFEFEKFLKNEEVNRRKPTEERLKALINNLNNIASTDEEKIASIQQAIAGNYPDFRKAVVKVDSGYVSFKDHISPPSLQEFERYFEENGRSKELAGKVYDSFAYNHHWKDRAGFSIIETWKEVVKSNNFYSDETKK
jgi:hypothetical protein